MRKVVYKVGTQVFVSWDGSVPSTFPQTMKCSRSRCRGQRSKIYRAAFEGKWAALCHQVRTGEEGGASTCRGVVKFWVR